MKIHIITVGKPKIYFARDGFAMYIKRLKQLHDVTCVHVNDTAKDAVILSQIGKTDFCFVCDENGTQFTSVELAQFIQQKTIHGIHSMSFVIGGPNGHSPAIIKKAHCVWSLSALTFPHDLAMVVVAEALYRVSTIILNHPYHRN